MPQQTISIGSTPNDGTGDPLRTGWSKTNSNFTELYQRIPCFMSVSEDGNWLVITASDGVTYVGKIPITTDPL